jgi:hypothetical protein
MLSRARRRPRSLGLDGAVYTPLHPLRDGVVQGALHTAGVYSALHDAGEAVLTKPAELSHDLPRRRRAGRRGAGNLLTQSSGPADALGGPACHSARHEGRAESDLLHESVHHGVHRSPSWRMVLLAFDTT